MSIKKQFTHIPWLKKSQSRQNYTFSPSHLSLKHIFEASYYTSYKVHLLNPSCCLDTPEGTDSSLKDTDSITEPNKDRHMDQNSITFKDGRGMFAGESHHTFQFFIALCWSVRAYERLKFFDSSWWWIIPGIKRGDSKRKWTPFNKRQITDRETTELHISLTSYQMVKASPA